MKTDATVQAKLTKKETTDGLMAVHSTVPLGAAYRVDPSSMRIAEFYNVDTGENHTKTIINVVDADGDSSGYLPVELLEIQGDA